MTQEQEDFNAKIKMLAEKIGKLDIASLGAIKAGYVLGFFEAIERLKAKLLSDEMVDKFGGFIRRAIINLQNMQEAQIDNTEEVSDMVDAVAKAALEAIVREL